MGKDRDDDDDDRFERKDYKGPGELTSALGEGAKGAAVWGGVGAGTSLAITKTETGTKVWNAVTDNDFVRGVGTKTSELTKGATNRLGDAYQGLRGKPLPTITSNMGKSGRYALITGGVLATVGAVTGMANGWGRASETRKSWTERENERSAMAAQLQR